MVIIFIFLVIIFYLINNIRSIILGFRSGKIQVSSFIGAGLFLTICIILFSVPSLIRGFVGSIILTILGITFSCYDVLILFTKGFFCPLQIIDFIAALSGTVCIFLTANFD